MKRIKFKKPILIYIPCHNCEKHITEIISSINVKEQDRIECLVIDNQSTDRTSELVLQEIRKNRHRFKIHLIRTKEDLGYAGSQKLAYYLACNSSNVKHVIMLHGDGQYPPSLLTEFISCGNSKYAIVNGYRNKSVYPHREETPSSTYYIIKILSLIESIITGYAQKEWHSGFVMYHVEFLKKIPFQFLSSTYHIDGEFLICAGILKEKTLAIPIYKKYRSHEVFGGLLRINHVLNTFRIIFKLKQGYYHRILKANSTGSINSDFDIITSTENLKT